MSDRITLRGLRAVGFHGVLPQERADGQVFIADVELRTSTQAAGEADALRLTVDYSRVAEDVIGVLEGEPVDLIEALAERIADVCLGYERVTGVTVTVHKPRAPISVPFDDVAVTIDRDA